MLSIIFECYLSFILPNARKAPKDQSWTNPRTMSFATAFNIPSLVGKQRNQTARNNLEWLDET